MMNNAVPIVNYQELCSDPARNPMGTGDALLRAIAAQYVAWSPDQDTDKLKEDVLLDMGITMSGGIGVMVPHTAHEGGILQVLHGIYKHAGRDHHRGKVFASLGDIQGLDIDVVELSDTLLAPTVEVIVAEDATRQHELFAANPGAKLVPAFTREGGRSRTISVRNSVYIPYSLIPFVLDKDLNARQAFETLAPVIQAQGLEAVCAPLLDYLIVSSTARQGAAAGTPLTATLQPTAGKTPERLLTVIKDRRDRLLFTHLPELRPSRGAQSDPALLGIMHAMRDVTQASKEDIDDRRIERERTKAPTTAEAKWPNHVGRLCKLCGVTQWEDLPAYWHDLAAYKRGSGTTLRGALQDQVDLAAHALGVQSPQMTVQHSTSLQNFLFTGGSDYSLKGGVLPFTITPPGATSAEGQEQQERDYERNTDDTTISTGNSLLTAADARALRSSSSYVPVDFDEADSMVDAYTAVLAAVLGQSHPNVQAHEQARKAYRRVRPHLKKIMTDQLGPRLAAATLVYHYHAQHRDWFTRQWDMGTTETLPAPDFSEGFRRFSASYNLMWLPNTNHVDLLRKLVPVPAHPGSPGGRIPPQATPITPEPTSPPRVRVRNNNRDPRFFNNTPLAVKLKNIRIKDLLDKASAPPPPAAAGERCLTWHVKGACFDDCLRSGDHVVLPPADRDKLYEWVKGAME